MTGARILADYPEAMVRIACRKCDRRGQYRRSSLTALYGEKAALPDVLGQLVHDCPKQGRQHGTEARGNRETSVSWGVTGLAKRFKNFLLPSR